MGVETRVTLYAENQGEARGAAAAAFARIAELDAICSDYRDESELERFCRHAPGEWVPVSEDLFRVLACAQEIARASGGAFDATVGPLVALWRETRDKRVMPARHRFEEARAHCGHEKLELDAKGRRARLAHAGMRLDLGGIAKGYAAQAAVELLRERGHPRCLVALAGDIVAGDAPPGRAGWEIATEHGRITLVNAAVSTSGDAEQSVTIDGVRYAHIIDPRTGIGLTQPVSMTVIAPRGELADALATAACVLGEQKAREILRALGATLLCAPAR